MSDDRRERLSVTDIQPSGVDGVHVSFSTRSMPRGLFEKHEERASLLVSGWPSESNAVKSEEEEKSNFVGTREHEQLLADMLISHHTADFCLVGAKVRLQRSVHNFYLPKVLFDTLSLCVYMSIIIFVFYFTFFL